MIDYYNGKSISMNIPETIKYKFGDGPIRFKKNGKYYHGVDPYQKNSYAWDPSENWTGCMWHYTNKNTKLTETDIGIPNIASPPSHW